MLAFQGNANDKGISKLTVLDTTLNCFFFIDIIMNFFTAYYDNDFNVYDDHKVSIFIPHLLQEIVMNYLKTWFTVDILSVIPFDLLLQFGGINRIARVTRIGKLYKIIRMTKMVRLLKIAKVRNKLVKDLSEMLKIGVGFERLLFLLVIFLLMIHIIACLWIFIAKFDETNKNNWIYSKDYMDFDDYELYVTSFYFSVTTVVTVGYGDITAISVAEKVVAVILMITGVIAFSFATGALSSIISSYDSTEAKLKEKMATLNEIQHEYKVDDDLFNRLVKTIRYDHSKKQKDVLQFMEELPHKLKLELAMFIYRKMFSTVKFFDGKQKSFIVWVGTAIRPLNIQEQEYIIKEGEKIVEMYFIVAGGVGFVLPRYNNKVYINIPKGEIFGHTDLLGIRKPGDIIDVSQQKATGPIFRKFTVMATINCELLTLAVSDLDKMKLEFPEVYKELYDDARLNYKIQIKTKKREINASMKEEEAKNSGNILAKLFFKSS